MLKFLLSNVSKRARAKRKALFIRYMNPCEENIILDLGSEDGRYISSIIPFRKNVFISDISYKFLKVGKEKYKFKGILLPDDGCMPFDDKSFDIVHCSSVIEHVTVKKNKIYKYKTWNDFRTDAFENQKQFANEIRRIAKNYFIQTPNKYFIIESHTLLPLTNLLSRKILMFFIPLLNKFWIKKTSLDWNLLSKKEFEELFPEAKIIKEKFLFMTKSLIAIKSDRI